VITKANRVWSVTLTLLMLGHLFGWRRRLCLNYVISERQLGVQPDDLFSANQIIHLRPLSGDGMYLRFLAANSFVNEFYPNFAPRSVPPAPARWRRLERVLDWTIAPLYERVCRFAYHRHLRRRAASWQSHDQVRLQAECLKLHTSSHRRAVMERFEISVAEAERLIREEEPHAQGVL
jgi:hypothetical protein